MLPSRSAASTVVTERPLDPKRDVAASKQADTGLDEPVGGGLARERRAEHGAVGVDHGGSLDL